MKNRTLLLIVAMTLIPPITQAQQTMVTVTIRAPEHGSLTIDPALPADGRIAAGTDLTINATPEDGYQVDSVYYEEPGIFGTMYIEAMARTQTFRPTQDATISALFLPEQTFDGFTVRQDIVYAQPGIKPLKYDVWTPDAADNLPIILIIHGGGWRANNEDIMRGMAREIVRTGRYVVVSMDYRWISTLDGDSEPNTMDDLINDVFGAIAHIQEHAASYGGNAGNIAVTGDSAGGHLSAVAGTMAHQIGDGGFGATPDVFEFMPSYIPAGKLVEQVRQDIMSAVKAAAPSYGVFSDSGYNGGPGLTYAQESGSDPAFAHAIAPIHHIPPQSERAIPHYLIRGTADPLISDIMVTEYVKALSAQNQRVRYDQVPHASHAFFDWKPDQATRDTFTRFGILYIQEMVAFFDSVFYPH